MRQLPLIASFAVATAVSLATARPALADEGMWTYDNFPSAAVKQKFGVDLPQPWLDRVRQATIRLSNCTASFVSPDGLILTNHHCAAACLAELSTPADDKLKNGFLAKERTEEKRCPTQIADVLMEMEDITAKVGAATRGLAETAANEARKKTLTQLEQACEKAAGPKDPRRCETVRLYQGGQTFLYKYKRYSDVRVVFAPEEAIAAFGGDPDNFQFPRWCLDMSILRAYENGKPVKTPNHLRINWQGPAEKEFVLVSGHPGSTDRLLTLSQLQEQREATPFWLLQLRQR
ncbi:S46 family peptidase, partial [bacterium]